MFYSSTYDSPLGKITLCSDGENLCGLWFDGQKHYGKTIPEAMTPDDTAEPFPLAKQWLDDYFVGRQPGIDRLPLKPLGTDFRQRVWRILTEIPYGQVTTYGAIAKTIAEETKANAAAQAVGGAVGHNPLSIIIPCHRVVGADGSLTGYAGGLSRKITLLEIEGVDMSGLSVPTKGTAL